MKALYLLRLFCALFLSFNGHIARYAPVFHGMKIAAKQYTRDIQLILNSYLWV